MTTFLAILFCILMLGLAIFQLCLIAGAPLGHFAWGGRDRVLPSRARFGSVISIVLYGLFSWIILQRAELIPLGVSQLFVTVATWVLAVYFLLGVVMNAVSRSRPERLTMTPLSFLLALICVLIAAS